MQQSLGCFESIDVEKKPPPARCHRFVPSVLAYACGSRAADRSSGTNSAASAEATAGAGSPLSRAAATPYEVVTNWSRSAGCCSALGSSSLRSERHSRWSRTHAGRRASCLVSSTAITVGRASSLCPTGSQLTGARAASTAAPAHRAGSPCNTGSSAGVEERGETHT